MRLINTCLSPPNPQVCLGPEPGTWHMHASAFMYFFSPSALSSLPAFPCGYIAASNAQSAVCSVPTEAYFPAGERKLIHLSAALYMSSYRLQIIENLSDHFSDLGVPSSPPFQMQNLPKKNLTQAHLTHLTAFLTFFVSIRFSYPRISHLPRSLPPHICRFLYPEKVIRVKMPQSRVRVWVASAIYTNFVTITNTPRFFRKSRRRLSFLPVLSSR
jgi:hypothetical protein